MGRRQANARAASRAHRRGRGLDDESVDSLRASRPWAMPTLLGRRGSAGSAHRGRRGSRAQSHRSSEKTDRVRNHHGSSSSSRMHRSRSRSEPRDDQVALRSSQRALDEHRERAKAYFSKVTDIELQASQESFRSSGSLEELELKGAAANTTSGSHNRHGEALAAAFPRLQLWLILAALQLVCIASLAAGHPPSSSHAGRTSAETGALVLASLTFALCLAAGAGMLHAPFRGCLTSLPEPFFWHARGPTFWHARRPASLLARLFQSLREATAPEARLSLLALLLICAASGLILRPSNAIAVADREVWNANLFYAAWGSLYAGGFLFARLAAGTFAGAFDFDGAKSAEQALRRWLVAGFSSLCAASALLATYSGNSCDGGLEETTYCHRSLVGGVLSVFGAALALAGGAFVVWASRVQMYDVGHHGGLFAPSSARHVSLAIATALVVLEAATVGAATAPSGPGYEVGSVFVASWAALLLGLAAWKGGIDALCLPASVRACKHGKRGASQRRRAQRWNASGRTHSTHSTDASDEDAEDPYAAALEDARSYAFSVMGNESRSREASVYEASNDHSNDNSSHASRSTLSYGEVLACVASLSGARVPLDPEDCDAPRRAAHDPEEATGLMQSSRGRGYALDADGTYRTAPHDATCARPEIEIEERSGHCSDSQAVQVRTGHQEEVSTLGGTLDLSRGTSASKLAPGGAPDGARARSRSRSRSRSRRKGRREANGALHRQSSRHFKDDPKRGKPRRNSCLTASTGSLEVDQEWDFDYGALASSRAQTREQPTFATSTAVPTATEDGPHNAPAALAAAALAAAEAHRHARNQAQGRMQRRNSLKSAASNLSPLTELSEEIADSMSQESKEKSKRRSKPANQKGRAPPPPPPRPRSRGKPRSLVREGRTSPPSPGEKKPSEGSLTNPLTVEPSTKKPSDGSSTFPRTIPPEGQAQKSSPKPNAEPQAPRRSHTADSTVSTSSSDFDILVSTNQSVVTELTQEGFDPVPARRVGGHNPASRKRASKSPRSKKSPRHAQSRTPPGPPHRATDLHLAGLPARNPLYNGTPSTATRGVDDASLPWPEGGQEASREVHPSVEAFLARAMERARNSTRGHIAPASDEEDSDLERAKRMQRPELRKSGGVNSSGSESDRLTSSRKAPGRGLPNRMSAYSKSVPDLASEEHMLDEDSDDEKHPTLTAQKRRQSMRSFFSEADEGSFAAPGRDYAC